MWYDVTLMHMGDKRTVTVWAKSADDAREKVMRMWPRSPIGNAAPSEHQCTR